MTSPDHLAAEAPTVFGQRFRAALIFVLLVAGLWLCLIRVPAMPTTDLDPSWRMALGYAVEHGWQFGRDIVFTYGPLGYVLAPTNSGSLYNQQLAWQLGANLIFALTIWGFGRSLPTWRRTIYYVYFFMFGAAYTDAVHMIMICLFALALTRERFTARPSWAFLASVALGVMALVKFTNLLLAGFAIVCVLGLHLWQRQRARAGVIAAGFALAFFGGWVVLGQSLAGLPRYVANSFSVSNGYVDSMGVDESGVMLFAGLSAALLLGLYYALRVIAAADRPKALAITLISAAATFLNWKHGYVRADGHVLAHFFLCLFFVSGFPVLLEDEPRWRPAKGWLLVGTAAFSLWGIWLNSPPSIVWVPSTLNSRIIENSNAVYHAGSFAARSKAEFDRLAKLYSLNGIKALVHQETIDILGHEQAYAIFNGFNFRARPTLQGYAAYNEHLEKLNADFYASDRAPYYVLQRINRNVIDGHLPAIEDALATLYVYHHYDFLMEDQEFLTWKRRPADPAVDRRELLRTDTVKFGEVVTTPDLGDTPVWCEFDIEPSLLGKIRTFFYKPPELHFTVVDGGNNSADFRMIRERARTGFLVYPHFTSNFNVLHYQQGEPGPRIAKMTALMPEAQRKYFQPTIHVRFYKLAPFPRAMHAIQMPNEIKFRVFNLTPVTATSAVPYEITNEGGKEVLFVHAPSSLDFVIGPATRHLVGHFGMIANSYQNGNNTDGAEFVVDWTDAAGHSSVLFHRLLTPRTVGTDRGEQSFEVELPAGGGQLRMRTTPGPNNDMSYDWTYWTDVQFTK